MRGVWAGGEAQAAARTVTVAFVGVEARRVEVQVQIAGGLAGLMVVGLADKAVSESRERVRARPFRARMGIPVSTLPPPGCATSQARRGHRNATSPRA